MKRRVLAVILLSVGGLIALTACHQPRRPLRPRIIYVNPPYLESNNSLSVASSKSLEQRSVFSKSLNSNLDFSVLLPPSYNLSPDSKYPLVLWLHGANGGQRSLVPLSSRFSKAMEVGIMPESVVVFPESRPLSMWVNSYNNSYNIEDAIMKDMIPYILADFRILPGKSNFTVAGFSMGGYGAARIGLKYNETFGNIILIGAGTLNPDLSSTPRADARTRDTVMDRVYGGSEDYFYKQSPRFFAKENSRQLKSQKNRLSIIVGDNDEVYSQNQSFYEYLKKLGLKPDLIVLPKVRHDLKSYVMASRKRIFELMGL